MTRVLFVTNGHGEAAIADRISLELRGFLPGAQIDHLALVGDGNAQTMHDVGPRKPMPSGGLIAMGNVRNLTMDLRAGLLGLTAAQARFLRRARGEYDVAIAVGDVFALAMTLLARTRTIFVGSAKSVRVAPYGRVEETFLRRAAACYVRDGETAGALHAHGVAAEAANAIVDLFETPDDAAAQTTVEGFSPALALFPGSRESAYDDAAFLLEVTRDLAMESGSLGAVISIARGLDKDRFAQTAASAGWQVRASENAAIPFTLSRDGREIVRAWRGDLGPLLKRVTLVLGQAGTANEAAAAAGVPVVAFESDRDRKARWYRQRQRGLLGDALAVFPAQLDQAVLGVRAILNDPGRAAHMGEIGRARMGRAGGARRIAQSIVAVAQPA